MNKYVLLYAITLAALLSFFYYQTQDDFREEGRAISRALIVQLQKIQTRDRLLLAAKNLEDLFQQQAVLIQKARVYYARHPERIIALTQVDHELSDALRMELERVYRIEGGRQMIEKCQEKAKKKLDGSLI